LNSSENLTPIVSTRYNMYLYENTFYMRATNLTPIVSTRYNMYRPPPLDEDMGIR
jgi:hypothetical protein